MKGCGCGSRHQALLQAWQSGAHRLGALKQRKHLGTSCFVLFLCCCCCCHSLLLLLIVSRHPANYLTLLHFCACTKGFAAATKHAPSNLPCPIQRTTDPTTSTPTTTIIVIIVPASSQLFKQHPVGQDCSCLGLLLLLLLRRQLLSALLLQVQLHLQPPRSSSGLSSSGGSSSSCCVCITGCCGSSCCWVHVLLC